MWLPAAGSAEQVAAGHVVAEQHFAEEVGEPVVGGFMVVEDQGGHVLLPV